MRVFSILSCALLSSVCLAAQLGDDYLAPCDKVGLGGDADWAPYIVINENRVGGVGMDLATKVFTELDIPIKYSVFSNHIEMQQALREETFDLLVSTYPNNDLKNSIDLVEPSYIEDAITVAVKIENIPNVTSWESLTGFHGVMDMTFTPDQANQEFFAEYLAIKNKLSMSEAIAAVVAGKAYYLVGSELQLRYAIMQNNLQSTLAIADIKRPLAVHMAFRKNSPCQQYAAFLSKRLQDFKHDGTLSTLVDSYEVNN